MTIRRFPEDFVVRERLSDATHKALSPHRTDQASFAVFQLVKMSVTTPRACDALARELGIRAGDIQFAGMKDRHACTTQIVTTKIATAARASMIPAQVSLNNVSADLLGWTTRHVRADDIAHNAFEIVVRSLLSKDCETMDHNASLACVKTTATQANESSEHSDVSALLMPNYFGDQRFGYQKADTLAGRRVIQGDYLGALKLIIATPHRKDTGVARDTTRLCASHWGNWQPLLAALPRSPARKVIEVLAAGKEPKDAFAALPYIDQQMCIESFQSHLWNAVAAGIISSISDERWSAPSATGELCFTPAMRVSQQLQDAQLPMPSPDLATTPVPPTAALSSRCSNLQPATESSDISPPTSQIQPSGTNTSATQSQGWFHAHLHSVVQRENLSLSQLKVPGLRRPSFDNFTRPLFVRAHDFTISPPEIDDADTSKKKHKRTLRFTLPRGVYATVLLRMLGQ